ncbi:helix-turn-helix domain-containing protein [Streptomyces sp. NPDC059761]|uniref:helix-turn-helix domain-containing protein n=1 Tax=Streptomyces sp. NPDC059761 TaxID=3346937 RepID=UPI00366963B4
MPSLAAKLRYLIYRLSPGSPPSTRQLSAAYQARPGHTRGGSHAAIAKLINGDDTNPTVSTVVALADVLNVPAAFLLPGETDHKALSVLRQSEKVREVVRHLEGLPQADLDALVEQLRKRRTDLGLLPDCPIEEIVDVPLDSKDDRRDRRKRSPKASAKYAADSLEGI